MFYHDHGVFFGSAEWDTVLLIFNSVIHHIRNGVAGMLEPFQQPNLCAVALRFVLSVFIELHVRLIVVEYVFYQYVFVSLVVFEDTAKSIASFVDGNNHFLHQELFNAHILCSQTGRLADTHFGNLPHFFDAVKLSHKDFVSREHVFEAVSKGDRHSHRKTFRDCDDEDGESQGDALADLLHANFIPNLFTYQSLKHNDNNCGNENDQRRDQADKLKYLRQVVQFILQRGVVGIKLIRMTDAPAVLANAGHESCACSLHDEVVTKKEWVVFSLLGH